MDNVPIQSNKAITIGYVKIVYNAAIRKRE